MLPVTIVTLSLQLQILCLAVRDSCVLLELNIKLFVQLEHTSLLHNNQLVITVQLDSFVTALTQARVRYVLAGIIVRWALNLQISFPAHQEAMVVQQVLPHNQNARFAPMAFTASLKLKHSNLRRFWQATTPTVLTDKLFRTPTCALR